MGFHGTPSTVKLKGSQSVKIHYIFLLSLESRVQGEKCNLKLIKRIFTHSLLYANLKVELTNHITYKIT